MNEELTTELAGQINLYHQQAQSNSFEARKYIEAAISCADNCATLLDVTKQQLRGGYDEWMREHAPEVIPHAKKYRTIKESRDRGIEHRQLIMLPILDKIEAKATDRGDASHDPSQSTKWIGWASNIRGWWTKTTRERPVAAWNDEEREAVRNQLKPLVDIYNAL